MKNHIVCTCGYYRESPKYTPQAELPCDVCPRVGQWKPITLDNFRSEVDSFLDNSNLALDSALSGVCGGDK